jgi:hypothetical protein
MEAIVKKLPGEGIYSFNNVEAQVVSPEGEVNKTFLKGYYNKATGKYSETDEE